MKKSMFRVLTLSLALSGVGVISSCKDYDEDLRTEMKSQFAGVDEAIQDKVTQMLQDQTVLQNILNQITQCDCGTTKPWMADLAAEIQKVLDYVNGKFAAMQGDIDGIKTDVDGVQAGLEGVQGEINGLKVELSTKLTMEQVATLLEGYYSKAEIDAIIAGLPKGEGGVDIETLKSELSTYILQKVEEKVTKEFVLALMGDKFDGYVEKDAFDAYKATVDALKAQVDAMTTCGVDCANLVTLIDNLTVRIKNAEDKIAANEGNINNLTTLYNDLNTYCIGLKSDIDAAKTAANNALATANAAKTTAESARSTAAAAKTAAEAAQSAANAAQSTANANKTEIAKLKNFQTTWESTLESWKNDIPVLSAAVESLTSRVEALESNMATVTGVASSALSKANDAYNLASLNKTEITTLYTNYTTLAGTVDELAGKIDDVNNKVDDVNNKVDDLTGKVDDLSDKVDENAGKITELFEAVGLNKEALEKLEKTVQKNREDFDKAVENLDKLTTLVNTVKSDLSSLSGKVDGIAGDVDGMKGDISSIQGDVDGMKGDISSIQGDITTIQGDVTTIQGAVDDLKNWSDDAKKELEQLLKDVEQNTKDVEQNAEDIKTLEKTLSEAIKELKKMITSIEIQATKNPLLGSFYLPTGLQTNLLALWYGQALNDGVFPCYDDDAAYIWKSQAMDLPEYNIAGDPKNGAYEYVSGQNLVSDSEGNAGTIYATINPSNVDFTGVEMSLVNSIDETSPFKLGAAKASNEKIQFGYTRANNAFYEIPVNLAAGDVHKVNIGVAESVKDAVKNVMGNITSPTNINIGKIATAVQDQLSEFQTDALGLKTWVEEDQRGVYSKYAIAGMAIKNPITYASFKDLHISKVPGFDKACSLIDKMTNKVNKTLTSRVNSIIAEFPENPELKKITLTDLTIDPISGDISTVKGKFLVVVSIVDKITMLDDGVTYKIVLNSDNKLILEGSGIHNGEEFNGGAHTTQVWDADGNTLNLGVSVEVDLRDEVQELYDEVLNDINKELGDLNADFNKIFDDVEEVNQLVQALNDYLDDVNGVIDAVKKNVADITDGITTVSNKIKSFLDKLNNGIVKLVNGANDYLQPVLFAQSNNGTGLVSGSKLNPSKISGKVTFFATNMLAEVVAPAFKRHIAVTNVLDKSGNPVANAKALADAVNSSTNMNRVLDGQKNTIAAANFKAGYVYEIAYSALDYVGAQVTKKYYVTVK